MSICQSNFQPCYRSRTRLVPAILPPAAAVGQHAAIFQPSPALPDFLQPLSGMRRQRVEFVQPLPDAGQVVISWTKQGLDGIEIQVDRVDGKGFTFVSLDTVPDYNCNCYQLSTLDNQLTTYRPGADLVGKWSDVVSIPFCGVKMAN